MVCFYLCRGVGGLVGGGGGGGSCAGVWRHGMGWSNGWGYVVGRGEEEKGKLFM